MTGIHIYSATKRAFSIAKLAVYIAPAFFICTYLPASTSFYTQLDEFSAPPNAVSYVRIGPDGCPVWQDGTRWSSRVAQSRWAEHGQSKDLPPSAIPAALKAGFAAWPGDRFSGGGTLGYVGKPCLVAGAQIAFVGGVGSGWTDSAVFLADSKSVRPVIKSKGPGFGSGDPGVGGGDPTPIGGSFCGIGSVSANRKGDLLFLADVRKGRWKRALFLYHKATGEIQKVVAVGEKSPGGTAFRHIGESRLNDRGEVIFISIMGGNDYEDTGLFKWNDGRVVEIFRHGGAAPGGGVIEYVASGALKLVDGTWFPYGGTLGDSGTVASGLGIFNENGTYHTIISTWKDGAAQLVASGGGPAPRGGTFLWVERPVINIRDEVAFMAGIDTTTARSHGGWYLSSGGELREVFMWATKIGTETVHGLGEAVIVDNGDMLVWASTEPWEGPGGHKYIILVSGKSWKVIARSETMVRGLGTIQAMFWIQTRDTQTITFHVYVEEEIWSGNCLVRRAGS